MSTLIIGKISDGNLIYSTMTASFCAIFGKEVPSLVATKKDVLSKLFAASAMAGKSSSIIQLIIKCGLAKIGHAKEVGSAVGGILASMINEILEIQALFYKIMDLLFHQYFSRLMSNKQTQKSLLSVISTISWSYSYSKGSTN